MKKKILLLEDNPIHGEAIFDGLEDMGFEVKKAQDVFYARKLLVDDKYKPDLFLFDITIQAIKTQGIQFAEELAKKPQHKDIPVLFITAHMDENDIAAHFPPGARNNLLEKPFDFGQLVNKIRQVMAAV
ncbi:MAG: response regulator [Candidatus Aminicenantes bacterium]|nr:response regulator [Candidatus Aminicenantes bacterium]